MGFLVLYFCGILFQQSHYLVLEGALKMFVSALETNQFQVSLEVIN